MEIGEIAKKIAENGGRLYLVGGAIRDEILGIETHDRDYCVEKLSEEKFRQFLQFPYKTPFFLRLYHTIIYLTSIFFEYILILSNFLKEVKFLKDG